MTDLLSQPQSVTSSPAAAAAIRTSVTGFAGMNFDEAAALSSLAQQILDDPIALQQLSDRVFELLERDIRLQRERSRPYGRG